MIPQNIVEGICQAQSFIDCLCFLNTFCCFSCSNPSLIQYRRGCLISDRVAAVQKSGCQFFHVLIHIGPRFSGSMCVVCVESRRIRENSDAFHGESGISEKRNRRGSGGNRQVFSSASCSHGIRFRKKMSKSLSYLVGIAIGVPLSRGAREHPSGWDFYPSNDSC